MLDAFAVLVGVYLIAVHQIDGVIILALAVGARLDFAAADLAAPLVDACADRPHAGLHASIQRISGFPVGRVNLGFRLTKTLDLGSGGVSGRLAILPHFLSLN